MFQEEIKEAKRSHKQLNKNQFGFHDHTHKNTLNISGILLNLLRT